MVHFYLRFYLRFGNSYLFGRISVIIIYATSNLVNYLYIKTIHDKMGAYLTRSNDWQPTSYNGKIRTLESTLSEGKRYQNRLQRMSYCFKYVGEAIYGYEELLLPIKELRERNEMKFIDTNLGDDFETLVSQYEAQYAAQ